MRKPKKKWLVTDLKRLLIVNQLALKVFIKVQVTQYLKLVKQQCTIELGSLTLSESLTGKVLNKKYIHDLLTVK